MLHRRATLAATLALPFAGHPARAAWPDRPVRCIVPFAAGGNLDTLMRIVAPGMSERLGQQVIIENRPGAGGNLGAEAIARAAPDGYAVLVGSNGALTINPLIMKSLPFDPVRDFAPIGLGFRTPNVLVVSPKLPVGSLAEFIAYAKARPGQVTCGSAGTGTTNHLLMELLNAATGAGLVHVPYRGSGGGTADLLSGQLGCSIDQITTALPQNKEGMLRIIGVGMPERMAILPDVASFAEVGVPGGGMTSFIGLLVPAGTPAEPRARLQQAFAGALSDPTAVARVEQIGNLIAKPEERTEAGFAQLLERERALARQAVALARMQPE